jgi:hypothetical protein
VHVLYKVLNVRNFGVAMLDKHTYVFLLIGKGGLSLVFGSYNMLRANTTYVAWVMSGHDRVAVNMDADDCVIVKRRRREAERIVSRV